MKKRVLAGILVAAVLLSMTACGQKKEAAGGSGTETAVQETGAGEAAEEKEAEAEKEVEAEAAEKTEEEKAAEETAAEETASTVETAAEIAAEEAAAGGTAEETAMEDEAGSGSLVGGWSRAESPVVPDEVKALLEKALEKMVGAEYTPVAYLGSQIVSGTNYAVLCRITPVVPDPVEKYGIVYLYEDLEGNAQITEVKDFEAETNINGLAGGWFQAETPEVTEEAKAAFDKALEGFVGTEYVPVALLSSQVVSGMNYCFLCEATVVYPGAETTYALVYVYQDLEGKAEITEIVNLEAQDK